MANRPRSHGLFGYYGEDIDLAAAAKEVEQHKGVVWRPIFSLKREDAERLGYDNADRWQALLNANVGCLASNLGIDLKDLRWYAAFHDEGDHPHVHLMIYSARPGREFLTEKGIENIRSTLARQIFADELQQIYEKQTVAREDVYAQSEARLRELLAAMGHGFHENAAVQGLLPPLADALKKHKGRMVYGYLRPETKKMVDAVVDALAEDESVARAYAGWCDLRREVLRTYRDDVAELPPLSAQPELKKVRNMVVREVAQAMLGPTDDREQQAEADRVAETLAQDELEDPFEDKLAEWKHLYRQARAGNPWAAYRLAALYLDRDGPAYDPQKALPLLERAVRQGLSVAQYRLARLLLVGDGDAIPQDVERAVRLLESAADQEDPYAQYLLGKLYLTGQEVQRDLSLARLYLAAAAAQGNEYAGYLLTREQQWQQAQQARLLLCGTRMVRALARVFARAQPRPRGYLPQGIDRRRLRELQEHKIALGHAEGDMEIRL